MTSILHRLLGGKKEQDDAVDEESKTEYGVFIAVAEMESRLNARITEMNDHFTRIVAQMHIDTDRWVDPSVNEDHNADF